MKEAIATLQKWIDESNNIVFFGGAGCSTESGIKDFRSVDGLYSESYEYPPETILSHSFFEARPDIFYQFHRDKLVCPDAKPNPAHLKLAELERAGKLRDVGAHHAAALAAGHSFPVVHHVFRERNFALGTVGPVDGTVQLQNALAARLLVQSVDVLGNNGAQYEEGLDQQVLQDSVDYIEQADILIVGGTSLVVYPAAGLLRYYYGKKLVLINMDPTPYDKKADLVIHGPIGQVLGQIQVR